MEIHGLYLPLRETGVFLLLLSLKERRLLTYANDHSKWYSELSGATIELIGLRRLNLLFVSLIGEDEL